MAQENHGTLTLFFVIWALCALAIFALANFAIILALFVHRQSDATMSTSLVLMFASSILSIIYTLLHLSFAYRLRPAGQERHERTYLESISRFLPRLLIISWIAASANGLMVAARQPRCMPVMASHDLWRAGLGCTLHRSATGLAVGALIVTCVLFCSIEVSDRPFYAGPLCINKRRHGSSFGLTPSPSELDCSLSPSSSLNSYKNETKDDGRGTLTRQLSDRAFWLQRQNSLSSRNAIYPPGLRQSLGFSRSTQGSIHSTPVSQVGRQRHLPGKPSYNSFRSTSTSNSTPANVPLPSVSEYQTSITDFPTRAPSFVSSSSSPLSTMRRASQPDIPIIPNRFLSVSSSSQASSSVQRRSSLPFAWSPLLHHAPLSADPAIRALSSNTEVSDSSVLARDDPCKDAELQILCPMEPAMTVNKRLIFRSLPRPALPRRATGHRLLVPPTLVVA